MTNLKEQLRRAIEESRTEQTKWRCPRALRAKVVDYALRRRQGGASVIEISRELGMSSSGLRRWLPAAKTGGGFREVRVLDVPSQPRMPNPGESLGLGWDGSVSVLQAP